MFSRKSYSKDTFIIGAFEKLQPIFSSDLTISTVLPDNLAIVRSSAATYFNNAGNLTNAAVNEARFNHAYENDRWVNKGLLVEKQATNYIVYSEDFTPKSDGWSGSLSAAPGAIAEFIAAEKGFRKHKVEAGRNNLFDRIQLSVSVLNKTISTYVSQGTSLVCAVARNTSHFLRYSFATKSIVYTNACSNVSVKNLNNISALSFKALEDFSPANLTFFSKHDTTNNSTFLHFMQAENLSYPSSLIRTNGAMATRSADHLVYKSSNFTGSVLIKCIRQDSDILDKIWIDYTAVTDPILSEFLGVGVTLQHLKVFDRILTAEEKSNVL